MRMFLGIIGLVGGILLIPHFSSAQFIQIDPTIIIDSSPAFPGPSQNVVLSAKSTSMDIPRSNLTWHVDGTEVARGLGKTSLQIRTKGLGEPTRVRVVATLASGVRGEATTVISPNTVDLLWESEVYTPSFYKGKSLVPPQGRAKIVAFPYVFVNGSRVNNDSLYFSWKFNGRVMSDRSGYGQNVFYNDLSTRENTISLSVLDQNRKTVAASSLRIPRSNPEVYLYEDHPLYGILFNKTLANTVYFSPLGGIAHVEPFFFSILSPFDSDFELNWTVNGKPVEQYEKTSLALFGSPGSEGIIDVAAKHSRALYQKASTRIRAGF